MSKPAAICTKCLLTSAIPNVTFDEQGVCSVCTSPQRNHSAEDRRQAEQLMTDLFEQAKAQRVPYHLMVLTSGGADSSYLLDLMSRRYGLRLLGLHIAEDIGRPVAGQNAQRIAKATGTDLMRFSMSPELVKRWIREGLPEAFRRDLGPHAGRDLFVHLRRSVSINIAARLGIPIVAEGVELAQFPRHLVFHGKRKMKNWREGRKRKALLGIFKQVFGDEYDGTLYDFDVSRRAAKDLPDLVFPNAILEYRKEMAHKRLAELGIAATDLRSAYTNTEINPYVSCFSYRVHGAHVNHEHMASEIRRYGHCRLGSGPVNREQTLEFLAEIRQAIELFAYGDEDLPDDLDGYGQRFRRLREMMGDDGIFVSRMRAFRKVRHFAEYFGLPLPEPDKPWPS